MGLEAALDEPRLDLHHHRPAGLELVRAHLDPGVRPMVTHPEHANHELPQGCLGRLDPRQRATVIIEKCAHPDFRAEACFDNATRANLGGLDHPGRVFLGLALLHRYKNSRSGSRLEPLFELLSEAEQRDAEILGKAMRFGAMFAVSDPSDVARLVWRPELNQLELKLTKNGHALFGEVAQARFTSLISAMKAEALIGERA